jgi:hypothetical protein
MGIQFLAGHADRSNMERPLPASQNQIVDDKTGWYVRVEGAQLGPYPSTRVRSLLMNGGLSLASEISRDRRRWQKIRDVAEVVPLKLRAELGDRSAQKLIHARRLAEQAGAERRQGFPILAFSVLLLIVLAIVGLALWRGFPQEETRADCRAPAAPGVNWSNCVHNGLDVGASSLQGANLTSARMRRAKLTATNLTGAKLRYADLSGADMSYAQLAQADLLGANLQGADLSAADLSAADLRYADMTGGRVERALLRGAKLTGSIWVDGRVCAEGSVGKCLR